MATSSSWGLWDDGWAMMEDGGGHAVFPLWPAREYADVYRTGDWSKYVPKEIPLADLLDRLLPQFREKGVLPGVFPTPAARGVTVNAGELEAALREEALRYE